MILLGFPQRAHHTLGVRMDEDFLQEEKDVKGSAAKHITSELTVPSRRKGSASLAILGLASISFLRNCSPRLIMMARTFSKFFLKGKTG